MKNLPAWNHVPLVKFDSSAHKVIAFFATFALSYLAARVGGVLVLRPQMVWPLWPGCALVTAILLLTSRRVWPVLLVAGLVGFSLYDEQVGLSIHATAPLLLADSIEILVAAVGASYVFGGAPRLNTVRALAKYSLFAVVLAPIAVASTAAMTFPAYSWSLGFLTESLALITLTPAILGWARMALTPEKKPKGRYLEAAIMFAGLAASAYLAFVVPGSGEWPVLLYALLPFLLWASLRLGTTGASTSMILVAFLAVLGAIRGRGPFTGGTPVHDVLSLQVFLLFVASSFMTLATLVEQHKTAEQELRKSENTLRASEELLREYERAVEGSEEMIAVLDREYRYLIANRQFLKMRNMTREQVVGHFAYEVLNKEFFEAVVKPKLDECFDGRVVRYETKYTYAEIGERDLLASYFPVEGVSGGIDRAVCILLDMTERKRTQESLRESEERFRLAAQVGKMYAYTWDVGTDVIVRSSDVSGVLSSTDEVPLSRQALLARIHPDDRALFNASVNERTPEHPDVQVSYRLLRPGGSFVWVEKTAMHSLTRTGSWYG